MTNGKAAPTVTSDVQWRRRRMDFAYRLKGVNLRFQPYKRWIERWNDDHCAACWATFGEADGSDFLHEGYATGEDYRRGAHYEWVCAACFSDLHGGMGWKEVTV